MSITSPWFDNVRLFLCINGLNNVWYSQGKTVNLQWLKLKVSMLLSDTFQQKWHSDINSLSKCDNYRLFKNEWCFENYLDELPGDLRFAFCKFRCRNFRLPVETRHFLPNDNGTCLWCSLNKVGNEFHYIFECTILNNVREKLLPKYYVTYPNFHKFSTLLNLRQPQRTNVARFVKVLQKKLITAHRESHCSTNE